MTHINEKMKYILISLLKRSVITIYRVLSITGNCGIFHLYFYFYFLTKRNNTVQKK